MVTQRGIKSHLYLRGELEIDESKWARRNSNNSHLDKLIKKVEEDEQY